MTSKTNSVQYSTTKGFQSQCVYSFTVGAQMHSANEHRYVNIDAKTKGDALRQLIIDYRYSQRA